MKCPSCHAMLMAADLHCPACGAASPLARAAASSLAVRAALDPGARGRYVARKWLSALTALAVGGLMVLVGVAVFHNTRTDVPTARELSAAEMARADKLDPAPEWVGYTPERTIATGVEYVKVRSRRVARKYLLLQVGDRWLVAEVAGHFSGVRVEGKIGPLDNTVLPKIREACPHEAARLLPFQLDAEYDIAARQRQWTVFGGGIGVFGLLLFFNGLRTLVSRPPPYIGAPGVRVASVAEPPPRHERGVFARALFVLVWMVVFFAVGAVVASQWATWGAADPEAGKRLAEASGQKVGPWLLLGSVGLAVVLGGLGRLPGTRR